MPFLTAEFRASRAVAATEAADELRARVDCLAAIAQRFQNEPTSLIPSPCPQGPPGDVSSQQLTDAIAGTANNPASDGPYTGDFIDPPTQDEMRAFRDWANNFFAATARHGS